MYPSVGTRTPEWAELLPSRTDDRAHAFDQHQTADRCEHDEVREANQQIELTDRTKLCEQPNATERSNQAT